MLRLHLKLYCTVLLTVFGCFANNSPSTSSEYVPTPPRVVTSLEIIYGSYGVPVDYSYNETTASTDKHFGSVPGCPQSIEGFPWVYYGNPPRCFLAGHHGPCSFGQKLFIQPGSLSGICGCQCLDDDVDPKIFQLLKNLDVRYVYCRQFGGDVPKHGQLYDKQTQKCYNYFEKGPCREGTVITAFTDVSITCLPICNDNQPNWLVDRDEGRCKQVILCRILWHGKNFCLLIFKTFYWKFQPPPQAVSGAGLILANSECRSGERYSNTLKKCVRQSSNLNIG